LLLVLCIIFAVWVGALLGMYLAMVRPARLQRINPATAPIQLEQ
jgi:hypothetical protein